MPCDNVTTCTFGGPGLRTLYITTARGGSSPGSRLAGSLYAVAMETPGAAGEPVPGRLMRPQHAPIRPRFRSKEEIGGSEQGTVRAWQT